MAFVCSATWVAKEGEAHLVAEALQHLSPASRTEAGNIYYQAYQDPAEPNTFRIFEVYKDEAAFKEHAMPTQPMSDAEAADIRHQIIHLRGVMR